MHLAPLNRMIRASPVVAVSPHDRAADAVGRVELIRAPPEEVAALAEGQTRRE